MVLRSDGGTLAEMVAGRGACWAVDMGRTNRERDKGMKNEVTAAEISRVMAALASRNKGKKRPGSGMARPDILEKCKAGRRAWIIRRRAEKEAASKAAMVAELAAAYSDVTKGQ